MICLINPSKEKLKAWGYDRFLGKSSLIHRKEKLKDLIYENNESVKILKIDKIGRESLLKENSGYKLPSNSIVVFTDEKLIKKYYEGKIPQEKGLHPILFCSIERTRVVKRPVKETKY